MKKPTIHVAIEPGCISCGRCQEVVPAVFEVTDCAHVKACAQKTGAMCAYEAEITQAAAQCPVQVIKVCMK
jgi:ferredoxin